MHLKQVLALVDFSHEAGIQTAWRAARLAHAHDANLCLLTLVELPDGSPASRFGAMAAPARARADLIHLAGQITQTLGLCPAVVLGVGAEGPEILSACASRADLATLAGNPRNAKLAQQLVAQHQLPTLLVRLPAASPHESAIVIDEPGGASISTLQSAARWFCKSDAIHAVRVTKRRLSLGAALAAPSSMLGPERGAVQSQALPAGVDHAHPVSDLNGARLRPAPGHLFTGAMAVQFVQEQSRHAAAVVAVVAERQRAPWARLLWPSLARQLSQRATCDILMVPALSASAKAARWSLAKAQAQHERPLTASSDR